MNILEQANKLYLEISAEIKKKYPILKDWDVKWNGRLRTVMGRAIRKSNGKHFIEMSSHLVKINASIPNFLDKFRETVLHEWAHALDWEFDKGWSHGTSWKRWMRTLGLSPERCYDSSLWLCQPKNTNFAIRNASAGKVVMYTNHLTPSLFFEAAVSIVKQGGSPDDVEVICLNTGQKK